MRRVLTAALLALSLTGVSSAQEQPTLGVGDAVPAIDIAHFFKGEPVAKFAKDRVYVLEFWATW